MISPQANGENRRWIAFTVGAAVLGALGTKLGEWLVEELRRKAGRPAPPAPKTGGTP